MGIAHESDREAARLATFDRALLAHYATAKKHGALDPELLVGVETAAGNIGGEEVSISTWRAYIIDLKGEEKIHIYATGEGASALEAIGSIKDTTVHLQDLLSLVPMPHCGGSVAGYECFGHAKCRCSCSRCTR